MCIKLLFVLAITAAFAGTVGRADTPQKNEGSHRRLVTQIGDTLEGSETGSRFGTSVSISDDGLTVLVGAPSKDSNTGEAFVFSLVNGVWEQQGDAIVAATPNTKDQFGFDVALSADGSVAAVSALFANSYTGYVSVFTFSSNAWAEVSNPSLTGDAANDLFGYSMAISSDGDVIASGAYGGNNNFGQVCVEMDPTSWTQLGDDINGVHDSSRFGYAVAISSDGETIVVGASNDNTGNSADPQIGVVRVFELSGSTCSQKGNDIPGDADGDRFGFSVDISADGNAIAASNNSIGGENYARAFEWECANWNQMGSDITTGVAGDRFGWSLSISVGGKILVVGATFAQSNGQAYLYEYDGSDWDLQDTLVGDAAFDLFGTAVALSLDGSTVIVGDVLGDASFSDSGTARVFETGLLDTSSPTNCPTTSPTQSSPVPTTTAPTTTPSSTPTDLDDTGEASTSSGGSPSRINPHHFLTQIGLSSS